MHEAHDVLRLKRRNRRLAKPFYPGSAGVSPASSTAQRITENQIFMQKKELPTEARFLHDLFFLPASTPY